MSGCVEAAGLPTASQPAGYIMAYSVSGCQHRGGDTPPI